MDLSNIMDEDMFVELDVDFDGNVDFGHDTEEDFEFGQEEEEDSFYFDGTMDFSRDNSLVDYDNTDTDGFQLNDETSENEMHDSLNTSFENKNHSREISFRGAGFCRHRGCNCYGWSPDYSSKYCKCGHTYEDHY